GGGFAWQYRGQSRGERVGEAQRRSCRRRRPSCCFCVASADALPWCHQRPGGLVAILLPPGRAVGVPAEPEGVRAPGDGLPPSPAPALALSPSGQPGRGKSRIHR
ncbi:unnamed protein product, partial [Ectocarpus sp. 12 AP-2014]